MNKPSSDRQAPYKTKIFQKDIVTFDCCLFYFNFQLKNNIIVFNKTHIVSCGGVVQQGGLDPWYFHLFCCCC